MPCLFYSNYRVFVNRWFSSCVIKVHQFWFHKFVKCRGMMRTTSLLVKIGSQWEIRSVVWDSNVLRVQFHSWLLWSSWWQLCVVVYRYQISRFIWRTAHITAQTHSEEDIENTNYVFIDAWVGWNHSAVLWIRNHDGRDHVSRNHDGRDHDTIVQQKDEVEHTEARGKREE